MSEKIKRINGPVPENLKRIMKEKRIKQTDLSCQFGVPRQRITDIIAGRRIVYAAEIVAFAEALGVPVGELFGETRTKEIRVVREEDSEVIASIAESEAIYKDGYRVEVVNDSDG